MGVQKKYVNRDKDLLCFIIATTKKKRKKKTTIKTLQNNA